MDAWGIGIFILGIILYFVSHKKGIFLFVSGIGAGIVIGAIWSFMMVSSIMERAIK